MKHISRRQALVAGVCGIFALGTSALPAAANSTVRKLANGKLEVRIKDIPELAVVGGSVRVGMIKSGPVAVTTIGKNKFTAISLVCPHAGTTVQRDSQGWLCPNHLARFEANGNLVLGPATTALKKVPARLSRGLLVVG
jgi:Rieske Fe-S protein